MKNRLRFPSLKILFIFWIFPTFFIFTPASILRAEDEGILNRLLAPGPLMMGHKKLEGSDCLKCHEAGKGISQAKCLGCHKEIDFFVKKKSGYHGLHTETCITCHADHKGRDYNSINVNEKAFNHKETGYELLGKHSNLKCNECHSENRSKKAVFKNQIRYFGKTASCNSCHQKNDIHFFKGPFAKKECSVCHTLDSWKDVNKFDHNRDTNFKLEGKHSGMKCIDCHGPNSTKKSTQYQWPQLKTLLCLSCHQDIHKNNLSNKFIGGKCNTCHSQEEWKIPKFDHSITQYELSGKHGELKCTECHRQRSADLPVKSYHWAGLKTSCLSCHQDEHQFGNRRNPHLGNLSNCLACHNERSWKQIIQFNHDKHTRYIIDGKHEELKCKDCHFPGKKSPYLKNVTYHWPLLTQKTCENCHNNPHIGKFPPNLVKKKCTECHITSGWYNFPDGKGFDHKATRFPLTGKHSELKCNDCHVIDNKRIYKFPSVMQKFCIDCHINVHTEQFSDTFSKKVCTDCHTTKNFTDRLNFDHNTTQYKLAGQHQKLNCVDCHMPTEKRFPTKPQNTMGKYIFLTLNQKQCLECHTDYHNGQLGNKCQSCHSERSWKLPGFDHNKQSQYKLLFKHKEVKCEECHKPIPGQKVTFSKKIYSVARYKPINSECVTCHKDVHKGSFGANCTQCHTERGWKITRDFHKNFTLNGVHFTLECNECHANNRKLAGLSNQCLFCHKKDDVHLGLLPNCGECHRQQFWEYPGFKHSMTAFPLRGAHRTVDCVECHQNGIYKGLSTSCVSCHQRDALAATSKIHTSAMSNCTDCHHNQFTFKGGSN